MTKTAFIAAFAALALGGTALAQQHQHGAPAAASSHQMHGQGGGTMPTQGQGSGHTMPGHQMHGQGAAPHDSGHSAPVQANPASASPSNAAFAAANERMHKDMGIPLTGNADVDFARGMIPHHQGAIDMARVVLQYGKDPEMKKLAQEIVSAQEKEIAFIQGWLKKQGQ